MSGVVNATDGNWSNDLRGAPTFSNGCICNWFCFGKEEFAWIDGSLAVVCAAKDLVVRSKYARRCDDRR